MSEGFDEDRVRVLFNAESRDHTMSKGHQAVVRKGEAVVWAGDLAHATSRDAIACARAWIDAEVGRQLRVAILHDRRTTELPDVLEENLEKIDDLKDRKAALARAIREVEDESRQLVRECNHPAITINMYEGTATYTYTVTERGTAHEVDPLQMSLFETGEETGEAPDIGDMAGGEFPEDEAP